MSFGLMVPADIFSSSQIREIARNAEQCGFDNLWAPEMFGRDPFITCATMLEATSQIQVGTAITNIYARDERAIKAAAFSLAESSDNRFELGIGISNRMGNEQRGLPWLPPVKKLTAFLDRFETTEIMFKHDARVPVYLAAHGPKLMSLAAERLDGAYCYMMPPAFSQQSRDRLGQGKKLHLMQPTVFETDPGKAREYARRAVSIYMPLENYHRAWREAGFSDADFATGGSDAFIDTLIAWGDQDKILKRYDLQRDHGIDQVILSAVNLDLRQPDTWDILQNLINA